MKWEMEEVEAVLEKIWDLHDKVSDAIHSTSRSRFLKSIGKNSKPFSGNGISAPPPPVNGGPDRRNGFVFVKGLDETTVSMVEAKSLNAIRTALEDLEDQLDFFHTVQSQQQAEWDAAIARVEQSRAILAMRLAEHQGQKYKVIEEAMAFVTDINTTTGHFVSHEDLCRKDLKDQSDKGQGLRMLVQALSSGTALAKGSVGVVLGNAAMFAVSLLALLQLNRMACRDGTGRVGGVGRVGKRRDDKSMRLSICKG
ncbi:Plastid division protein PDV1 [Rhynchospora pubera]|uniref:Plastid division protein PDV1 n=1 Tax=Rhynchospora pubera TaxID=906938 RepID=A0AAV8DSQ5_9POAL|nr:Plastid division protein PDV1 [Rhynchospora pubera]